MNPTRRTFLASIAALVAGAFGWLGVRQKPPEFRVPARLGMTYTGAYRNLTPNEFDSVTDARAMVIESGDLSSVVYEISYDSGVTWRACTEKCFSAVIHHHAYAYRKSWSFVA